MFENVLGHDSIKGYLQKALLENCLPQTLLFAGPDGIGKGVMARALAAQLLKSERSSDLHVLAPEGKSGLYAIDTLREMIDKEHAAPFESVGKVFILEEADRMQPASANALLKTLEEPTADTTFILLSSATQEILPTILSRCVVLHFQPLTEQAIGSLLKKKGHSEGFAKLAQGSAGRAFELAEQPQLEEQRKILFSILRERPSYPELSLRLKKLEEIMEEEDPIKANRHVEALFAYTLMWNRDQEIRTLGGRPELLFFPEEPRAQVLEEVEKKLAKTRLIYQRNIKLSVALESLFLNK